MIHNFQRDVTRSNDTGEHLRELPLLQRRLENYSRPHILLRHLHELIQSWNIGTEVEGSNHLLTSSVWNIKSEYTTSRAWHLCNWNNLHSLLQHTVFPAKPCDTPSSLGAVEILHSAIERTTLLDVPLTSLGKRGNEWWTKELHALRQFLRQASKNAKHPLPSPPHSALMRPAQRNGHGGRKSAK